MIDRQLLMGKGSSTIVTVAVDESTGCRQAGGMGHGAEEGAARGSSGKKKEWITGEDDMHALKVEAKVSFSVLEGTFEAAK